MDKQKRIAYDTLLRKISNRYNKSSISLEQFINRLINEGVESKEIFIKQIKIFVGAE